MGREEGRKGGRWEGVKEREGKGGWEGKEGKVGREEGRSVTVDWFIKIRFVKGLFIKSCVRTQTYKEVQKEREAGRKGEKGRERDERERERKR